MTQSHTPWTKNYQPGVPEQIETPTDSLVELFETAVAGGGDSPAMTFFGKQTTYRKLGEQVVAVAEGLRKLGVKPGDRIAIVLPNCPQHVVAFYAAMRIGAIVVEHNPLYTSRELLAQFQDHRAKVAIAWDKSVEKISGPEFGIDTIVAVNMLDEFPTVKRLALNLPIKSLKEKKGALTTKTTGTTPWSTLVKGPAIAPDYPKPTVDDTAVIQYTSGTTGSPKGAMLTHLNLYANARQGAAWMLGAEERKENSYALLPMFHAFGMTLYLTFGIMKQANLVIFPQFNPDMVLDEVKKYPPTIYCAVPPIYKKTAERARERNISLSAAKYCISGAMKLTDDIVEEWEALSGGLLVEGYGMTEASPVALGNPFHESRRTGTIGVPFPSTYMKVVDIEDPSIEVAQGEEGELLLRGPQVFSGYWENEEETTKTLLPGGWLRTGDIVTVDEDGFATIVDRVKELIITGGFNVSPSEVEQVLQRHPAIEEAAVVGIEKDSGEEVVAAVVVAPGHTLDAEEIREFCRQYLARYKVPRRITVMKDMPKSMLGKVLRKKVKEQIAPSLI
ncbi:long-chain fatty acid--CoA ligase [Flaviflexus ciconiae]|uniref:Long-chain fatty acid--CoA ligase n=1 Tax=Flaviflexus ciconiae TaxID=2496867 RepID=A0A3S9PYP3_9ACTO|nr:long-chain-fatty-acid--CoA ligase [Flaviflexus ciconiae]AZQ77472.1 long-chain fatty acid--CoA ligase [Flaviflexus ciconiae]